MSTPVLIELEPSDTISGAAAKIALQPEVIVLLLGNIDTTLSPQVRSFFERAVGPIALFTNALIIDDGMTDGLASLMGQAAQQLDQSPSMLGILSFGATAPDANHKVLMRLPAEWTDTSKYSFLLAAELAKSKTDEQMPVVAILVGGVDADKATTLRCARHGWPLLVMQGAGGLGDDILLAMAPPAAGAQPSPVTDPDLREILDTASISPLPIAGNTDDLKRILLGPIQQSGDVLENAWSRYDDLDLAAIDKQKRFRITQLSILSLTVVATLLAIVITMSWIPKSANFLWMPNFDMHRPLHVLMIILPILISILAAFNARFREGNKWILLRAAAESIKREIFRYRTRSGSYSEEKCSQVSAPSRLASNMKDITANLAQSEVNRSSIPQQNIKDGKRLKFLNPDGYLHERLDDQIGYFVGKTGDLNWQLKILQICILVVGGLGTFLAAIHFEVWVALTAALATACTNKLEIDQVENSLVQYNTALTNLRNIKSWWKGLSPWEKTRRKNIDLLVDQTETALEHETAGWVQQMQSTLDKLMEKEKPDQKQDSGQKG